MDKYREYLPQSGLAFIDRDPMLAAAFSAHKYACDSEPVAPFLFQDLRGGEMERLRPIFALYGQPGLNLLRQLQEIDTRTRDTAQTVISGGQTAYAGYFFTRPEIDVQAAREAAKDYIRAVNRIFEEELGEPATVVATGGLARFVTPLCRHKIIYDEALLLKGLLILYEKNKAAGK